MMRTRRTFHALTPLLLTIAAGCSGDKPLTDANTALAQADEVELYSLEPVQPTEGQGETLRGWKVLGKTVLKGGARTQVVDAVRAGLHRSVGGKCFHPRHALRATRRGRAVDVLLCFECRAVRVYDGDAEGVSGLEAGVEAVLDGALREAGVPLADKPKRTAPPLDPWPVLRSVSLAQRGDAATPAL